jgi:hypothetical protein
MAHEHDDAKQAAAGAKTPIVLAVAQRYTISPGTIHATAVAALALASGEVTEADVHAALRGQLSSRIGHLAMQVDVRQTWDDLVANRRSAIRICTSSWTRAARTLASALGSATRRLSISRPARAGTPTVSCSAMPTKPSSGVAHCGCRQARRRVRPGRREATPDLRRSRSARSAAARWRRCGRASQCSKPASSSRAVSRSAVLCRAKERHDSSPPDYLYACNARSDRRCRRLRRSR